MHRYSVVRVEPSSLVSVCFPTGDYQVHHENGSLKILSVKSMNCFERMEDAIVPTSFSLREGKRLFEMCEFSSVSEVQLNLPSNKKFDGVKTTQKDVCVEFIRRFFDCLKKTALPTTPITMSNITFAIEYAKSGFSNDIVVSEDVKEIAPDEVSEILYFRVLIFFPFFLFILLSILCIFRMRRLEETMLQMV